MRTLPVVSGLLLTVVLFASGCGAEADDGDPLGPTPDPAATALEITVWAEGEGQGQPATYTLTCDPPGGDHPDPDGACAALEELGAGAFDPVPAEAMCTQQYGGPQQARVVGTIGGEQVDARLAYTDGCEIARWDAVTAVVPNPGGPLR